MDNNIRPVLWTTLMLSLLFFLSACTNQVEPEETTLRVGLLEHRNISGTQEYYTQLYQIENPHVNFEFMAATHDPNHILMSRNDYDSIEQMTALMAQTPPPDVVILDYNDYNYFAREGKLIALDDLMRKSNFSTEDFHPTVIEGLRNPEDHLLYGLTLSFDSYVLVYNKQIFDEAGVEHPRDHMTWDEMFTLAQKVTVRDIEQPTFGFSFYGDNEVTGWGDLTAYYTSTLIGKPYHNQEMDVNNEQWRDIFSTMKGLNEKQVFPIQNPPDERPEGVPTDPFLAGRLAMTLKPYSEVVEFISLNEDPSQLEGFEPFAWDVVTVPVHPEAPDVAPSTRYGSILAIPADSQNVEQAWELIAFTHDPKRNESKISELAASQHSIQYMDSAYNLDAFYKLNPAPHRPTRFGGEGYNEEVMGAGATAFAYYIMDRFTLDEALEYWEAEGNLALQGDEPDG